MKISYCLLFIVSMAITSCTPHELPPALIMDGDKILMKVSHQSTKEEMLKWQQDLSAKNIELNFSNSEFFDEGKIRKLSFTVKFPDGTVGSAGGDLVSLQYRYIGFIYSSKDNEIFKVGDVFKEK
ncbi:MAG: hypothetical protein RLZZ546_2167 [Bacteroidota bacterium]|jgi:hypothetical protein